MEKKPFWKGSKFWMGVAAALVPPLNHFLDLGLSIEQVASTIGPLMAYILGQGLADLGKNKKG